MSLIMSDFKNKKNSESSITVFETILNVTAIVATFLLLCFLPELVYFLKDL